ncbi:MAG TPA: SDR family oxidoreductase [Dehalococcoidia bacterium]|nr:SDR family oxidoreductase [Dehalococcoidia bacterium]
MEDGTKPQPPQLRNVLVTGGAGYIGAVLVPKLVARGYNVRVLDRFFWGEAAVRDVLPEKALINRDIREIEPSDLRGIDAVVHLAGLSNDPTAEFDPIANHEMNAEASERLARACRESGVRRMTFGSSCSIYDGLPPGPIYDETAPVQPKGAYAMAKRYAEERILEISDPEATDNAGFSAVVLRQATVYGYSPRMRFDLVVNTFLKDALTQGKLFLHGGGWMWRPLVDVADVAEAHIVALESPARTVAGEVFNVVHSNYQIRELAMIVAGSVQLVAGRQVELEEAPMPRFRRDYRCSNAKLATATGFLPEVGVLESVQTMLERLRGIDARDFSHPRYYNIEWMTLLTEMHEHLRGYARVL